MKSSVRVCFHSSAGSPRRCAHPETPDRTATTIVARWIAFIAHLLDRVGGGVQQQGSNQPKKRRNCANAGLSSNGTDCSADTGVAFSYNAGAPWLRFDGQS